MPRNNEDKLLPYVRKKVGGVIKEKIKIISDGNMAEVWIDGKKVLCTDIDLRFSGHVGCKPMIVAEATWHKVDEYGKLMISEDGTSILTEGIKINC